MNLGPDRDLGDVSAPHKHRQRGGLGFLVFCAALFFSTESVLVFGADKPATSGFLQKADAAFAVERYEEALKFYRLVLAGDAANGAARKGIQRCEKRLQGVIRSSQESDRDSLFQALRELKRGNVVDAHDHVLAVLDRTPDHPDALRFQGEIRRWAQRARRAGRPPETALAEGDWAYVDRRYQDAIGWWEKARSLSPTNTDVARKITQAQQRLAPDAGTNSVPLPDGSPAGTNGDTAALLKEGKALLEDRRYEPAIQKFELILKKDPRHEEANRCLAGARETAAQIAFSAGTQAARNGDLDQAENLLDSAVKHKPEFTEALEKLNWVREENRQRKIERAEKLYRQALSAALSGDTQKAKDLGRVASELNPENEEMRRFLDRLNQPGRAP